MNHGMYDDVGHSWDRTLRHAWIGSSIREVIVRFQLMASEQRRITANLGIWNDQNWPISLRRHTMLQSAR